MSTCSRVAFTPFLEKHAQGANQQPLAKQNRKSVRLLLLVPLYINLASAVNNEGKYSIHVSMHTCQCHNVPLVVLVAMHLLLAEMESETSERESEWKKNELWKAQNPFNFPDGRLFLSFRAGFLKDLAPVICAVSLKVGVMTVKKTPSKKTACIFSGKHN